MSDLANRALFAAVTPAPDADPVRQAAEVRALTADGADPSARDEGGATPLHRAVRAPYEGSGPLPSPEVVRALLECGADVHAVDGHGVTAAGWAVCANDSDPKAVVDRSVKVLGLLVGAGARLDGRCSLTTGGSFAHYGCAAPPVLAFLLDHGAPLEAVDERGRTPLHSAVDCGRPRLVELLLERHADTGAVDRLGRTPLGVALRLPQLSQEQRRTRAELVAALEAAGAPARVEYPAVEGGPLPIDMAAARRVAEEMRAGLSEVCRAAGVPDGSGRLTELTRPDFDSFQDLLTGLRDGIDPDHVPLIPKLCARTLGDGARTDRTLTGDQEIREPFFHHGNLLVEGHLNVLAPFVVTGSLTVGGCLADCGPSSVVAVGRDVTARGVHTDGEMSVGGDIEAEVVYGYYNDQTLRAGTIRARLVIEDEHETIAAVEADTHFDLDDFQQGYGEGVQEELRELLVDEVFGNEEEDDEEEQLDQTLLFARLREGKPVFRADV
ncbi:ankyrin repeat domain-containing protein [Streptomyces sp. NPDC057496]|uniref:ankyrin repeat domain-containing protein n=1 Tax=Streptomyces sp. NPDC057496 TaxID=3346149 RepID=UPI0036C2E3AC